MCKPIARQNLIDWLSTQRKVLAHWLDNAAANNSQDTDLIESLEAHYNWLSGELVRQTSKMAPNSGITAH